MTDETASTGTAAAPPEAVRESIREFVQREVVFDGAPVSDDTTLLDGAMDSLGLMQLVAYLEDAFQIELDDAEITADNFRTVSDIADLVLRTSGASGRP